ncbi:MAG: XRE family transcriptional regulator [Desulfovibrio sp.]
MSNRIENERQGPTQELPLFYHRTHWRRERGLSCEEIGGRLGVTGQRVSVIFKRGRCPARYIPILRDEFGMPDDLLPLPSREKPGPLSAEERRSLSGIAEERGTA